MALSNAYPGSAVLKQLRFNGGRFATVSVQVLVAFSDVGGVTGLANTLHVEPTDVLQDIGALHVCALIHLIGRG